MESNKKGNLGSIENKRGDLMATNTKNYNLVKPAENELADISVLNKNMDVIDEQILPVNGLNSVDLKKPLAAAQGKVLNEKIGDLSTLTTEHKENLVQAINEAADGAGITVVTESEYKDMQKAGTVDADKLYGIVDAFDSSAGNVGISDTLSAKLGLTIDKNVEKAIDTVDTKTVQNAKAISEVNKSLSEEVTARQNIDALKADLVNGKVPMNQLPSINLASYLAFCTNANSDSLDAAFGKNNVSLTKNIGMQMAMYAWFKGENVNSYPYTYIKTKEYLTEIFSDKNAYLEYLDSQTLQLLVNLSPYAKTFSFDSTISNSYLLYKSGSFYNNFGGWQTPTGSSGITISNGISTDGFGFNWDKYPKTSNGNIYATSYTFNSGNHNKLIIGGLSAYGTGSASFEIYSDTTVIATVTSSKDLYVLDISAYKNTTFKFMFTGSTTGSGNSGNTGCLIKRLYLL